MKFVPRVVLFDRRLRNRVAALIPDWVEDFVDLLRTNKVDVTEFLDLLKFLFTFVYSVFCSRHFYLRLGVILNRRNPPKAIPALEKPIPYLLKLFVALNIVAYLDRKGIVHVFFVKWLPSSQIDFNLAVLAFVFFFPMFAFLVIVMLAALIKLFRFSAYDSRLRRATPRLNRQLVALLLRRNFWRRSTFRYKEFLGGIIYYSVNAVILIPVSYYAFLILTTILLWPLATFVGRFQIITPEAATVAASAAFNVIFGVALVCLYVFITQPMLNLVLYSSKLRYLKQGAFMRIYEFEEKMDYERLARSMEDPRFMSARANRIFLDWDLENTTEKEAAFELHTEVVDKRRRLEITPFKKIDEEKLRIAQGKIATDRQKAAEGLTALSQMCYNDGDYEDALRCANEAATFIPNDPGCFAVMIDALIALGRMPEAIIAGRKGRQLAVTEDYKLYSRLGRAYFKMEEWESARDAYERAASLELREPATAFNLGLCYIELRNSREAAHWFGEYLRRWPDADDRAEVQSLLVELVGCVEDMPGSEPPP